MQSKPRFGSEVGQGYISPFLTSSQPIAFGHRLYLKSVLEHPEEMVSFIEILSVFSENDQVEIHVNTPGGAVYSLDSLLHAMRKCEAHIHGICTGEVASAGTWVALNCDSIEVSPDVVFLFHSATYGVGGKQEDVRQRVEFETKHLRKFIETHYEHFFTSEEIDKIINEKHEWYMDADEFLERYERRNTLREADNQKAEDLEQQMLDEMFKPLPKKVLNKIRKDDLIRYLHGEIDIDEDGNIIEDGFNE